MMAMALLEVMDKEPSLPGMWICGVGFGALGYWAGRRWFWPAIPVLTLAIFWTYAMHVELTDPWVGPAIVREAGHAYVVQGYFTGFLSIALTMAGMATALARRWRGRGAAAPSVPSGAAG